MKEASAALHRIERHVKRVFEIPQQANGGAAKRRVVGSAKPRTEVPTISSGEALTVFDELSALFDGGKAEAAQDRLEQMHVPDLRLVAHELGVTFRSRPIQTNSLFCNHQTYQREVDALEERKLHSNLSKLSRSVTVAGDVNGPGAIAF